MSEELVKMRKREWGPGPWQDEADRVEWRDEATGYVCLITRHWHYGNLCGYVGVPEGHPLFGKECDSEAMPHLSVHGGLTYSAPCSGEICHVPEPGEPEVFWFGFDCGHGFDFLPFMNSEEPFLASLRASSLPDLAYRDMAYVKAECAGLARQLAAVAAGEDLA